MSPKQRDRGTTAEEALRNYFLSTGVYAVRGVKFKSDGSDITDLDLWLYARPNSFTRQRINVDIKNRQTPQARERILWAKGTQEVLQLDACIVATTEGRANIAAFAKQANVTILDGAFLKNVCSRFESSDRLSEEELMGCIKSLKTNSESKEWIVRIERAKSRLINYLNFDGCNAWLNDWKHFSERSITLSSEDKITAGRLVYLMTSLFLVGVDFSFQDFAFWQPQDRYNALRDGFRFGESGAGRHEQALRLASKICQSVGGKELGYATVREHFEREFKAIPAEILAEHFSKPEVSGSIFKAARDFDHLAYEKAFKVPDNLTTEQKSLLCVILDFIGIERKKFFDAFGAKSLPVQTAMKIDSPSSDKAEA